MIHITHHAIQRFQERVKNLPEAEIRARLSTRAFQVAAEFGARFVRLPTGHRVIVLDGAVITVLPDTHKQAWMATRDDHNPGSIEMERG